MYTGGFSSGLCKWSDGGVGLVDNRDPTPRSQRMRRQLAISELQKFPEAVLIFPPELNNSERHEIHTVIAKYHLTHDVRQPAFATQSYGLSQGRRVLTCRYPGTPEITPQEIDVALDNSRNFKSKRKCLTYINTQDLQSGDPRHSGKDDWRCFEGAPAVV